MKRGGRDYLLLTAVFVLIGLVIWLIILAQDRARSTDNAIQQIQELKTQLQSKESSPASAHPLAPISDTNNAQDGEDGRDGKNGADGKDGIDGLDGAAGRDGKDGEQGTAGAPGKDAYQVAVDNGFSGGVQEWLETLKVKGDKGDTAPAMNIDCINGLIMKQYEGDLLWQPTRIKCEVME